MINSQAIKMAIKWQEVAARDSRMMRMEMDDIERFTRYRDALAVNDAIRYASRDQLYSAAAYARARSYMGIE